MADSIQPTNREESTTRPTFNELDVETRFGLPAYTDMADADPSVAAVAISLGNVPRGIWWHDGDQWYSGDRVKFAVPDTALGGNSVAVYDEFAMPTDMEIDVWQAHISVIEGASEDVYLDVYDSTADSVLFEHGFAANGNVVEFGGPIDVVPAPAGNDIQLRSRNDTGGSVTFSGWLVWSFQEQLA